MTVLLVSLLVSTATACAGGAALAVPGEPFSVALAPALTTTPATPAAAQQDEVDSAFEPLQRQLRTLLNRYGRGANLTAPDRRGIEMLLEEVRAFSDAHPDYAPALAAELELLSILTRTDMLTQAMYDNIERSQEVLVQLLDLLPANPALRLMYARNDLLLNRYDAAQATLEGFAFNYADQPVAGLLLARCYFAAHRFDDALDVLDQIPAETSGDAISARVEERRAAINGAKEHWEREQALREDEASADDLPRIEIRTARGSIVVELFEDHAPNHVANIITLAEQGFYDSSRFHRVISNFMAQGGDPNTRPAEDDAAEPQGQPGTGGPGYTIADEHTREDARMHFTGSLSMAKTNEPHSGGSQFFLCHEPATHLNGRHTVFGRVLEGIDVVRALRVDDVLETITVLRKRDHPYAVEPYDPSAEQEGDADADAVEEDATSDENAEGATPEDGETTDGDEGDDAPGDAGGAGGDEPATR